MSIFFRFIVPIMLYTMAFSIMDMDFLLELGVGILFITGATVSTIVNMKEDK